MSRIYTTESVTEAHPDKLADRISDGILDSILAKDPKGRVACETMISNGFCVVAGEIKTNAYAPITEIAREIIRESGYTNAEFGFDYRSAGVLTAIGEQSHNVSDAVDNRDGVLRAGDSGFVHGFACEDTEELMPYPITKAHILSKALAEARKSGVAPFLYPDGKVQLGVEYIDGKVSKIDNIVIHAQHSPDVTRKVLEEMITEEVVKTSFQESMLKDTNILINPTGLFVTGGPQADTGLTGRKSVSDTYGGAVPHGGSSLSGKDPSKPDRSGAYLARYIAKNLVGAKVAKKALVQISYVIGLEKPMSITIDTYDTSKFDEEEIIKAIKEIFPLTIEEVTTELNLLQPIYKDVSTYGHFGKKDLSWEQLDRVEKLKKWFAI
ncbi:MAG: methionine adenosyltransferase [Campylobacterales bacterium]|nr:methionine adenosyltransferase [Campylobacterales bacterium]